MTFSANDFTVEAVEAKDDSIVFRPGGQQSSTEKGIMPPLVYLQLGTPIDVAKVKEIVDWLQKNVRSIGWL